MLSWPLCVQVLGSGGAADVREACSSLHWCAGFPLCSPQPVAPSGLGTEGAVWVLYLLSEHRLLHRAAEKLDWELRVTLEWVTSH